MAIIGELAIHPLKAARGIARDWVRLAATGFEWDRHWMIVDAAGVFVTQRTHPRLARIAPSLGSESLLLRCSGLPPLELPLDPVGTVRQVRVWQDHCDALDQGEEAARWLQNALDARVRLVRIAPSMDRRADAAFAGPRPAPLAFPDGYPILVCNSASLAELNARMPAAIPMTRFRPNLVLDGLPAFAEDRITSLRIGAAALRLVKPCTRCIVPSTDQLTGERSTDPLPALRAFRFDRTLRGVTFGENAVIDAGIGRTIARGDAVEVEYDP